MIKRLCLKIKELNNIPIKYFPYCMYVVFIFIKMHTLFRHTCMGALEYCLATVGLARLYKNKSLSYLRGKYFIAKPFHLPAGQISLKKDLPKQVFFLVGALITDLLFKNLTVAHFQNDT